MISPIPTSSLSDHLYPTSVVERSQAFQDNSYVTIVRRLLKGGIISSSSIANSEPGNMDGNGSQQQVPYQSTTSHPLESLPFSTPANPDMDSFRSGEDEGSLQSVGQSILWSPTFADVSYSRDLHQPIFTHRRLRCTSTTSLLNRKTNLTARTVKDCSMVVI